MTNKRKRGISLPWERQGALLWGFLAGRRWKILLVGLFVVVLGALVWDAAAFHARVRTTRMAIAEVRAAVREFRDEIGRCPEGRRELIRPPRSGMRYGNAIPRDGWGRELYIGCPSPHDPDRIDVISAGPSGSFFVDDNVQ